MKVHNLSIDSSQHTVVVDEYSNTFSNPNNYTVHLKNPIYDVSQIKLVSARIPTPQLMICPTNNTFSVNGTSITLDESNYSNGHVLAQDLETILAPPSSNVSLVVFDDDTNSISFSNVGASNAFTFEFFDGTNGFLQTSSFLTTPHQLIGFSSNNQTSTDGVLRSGAINLNGPNSLVLKLTTGSDEFTQSVYGSTPFYTGHILLNGSDFINIHGGDDPLIHHFHSGPQKIIKDLKIEFFYMSHGRLIPYDFRNQDHILKFEITCSTDKLEGLPKVPITNITGTKKGEVEVIKKPEVKVLYNQEVYIYIGIIIFFGGMLMLLTNRKPLPPPPSV
jgi:hypothetical protein